jgi:hypothetical protein
MLGENHAKKNRIWWQKAAQKMKYVLLPLTLLLIACEPTDEPQPIEALQEVSACVKEAMIPYYPYFTQWEYCIINGEQIDNVQFVYTDLGLGYMIDSGLYYRLDMTVEYCEGVIIDGING